MRLERLSTVGVYLFECAMQLYQSAFLAESRRDISEQQRVMKKQDYHFDLIMEDDRLAGIILYWETEGFVYIEHFVTLPEFSAEEYGQDVFDLLKKKNKLIISEIEPQIDETTKNKHQFYKKNGFITNPYCHTRAKYRLADKDVVLKILTYPRVMQKDEYRSFHEYMTREIGIKPNESKDVTIRCVEEGDNLNQIAKLIYLTDPYVYPNWFDSMDDGIKVIRRMIDLPTLYSKENITVAVTPEGIVAGMIVSKQAPFREDIKDIKKAFELSGIEADERTDFVYNAYYAKMGESEDGYYIANVAVDNDYRKHGIAAAMMNHVMNGKKYCTLECVIANTGAWRLYQRLGYKIAFEYPGVYGIPCYKMYHKSQE